MNAPIQVETAGPAVASAAAGLPVASAAPLLTESQLLAAIWPHPEGRPSVRWLRKVRAVGGVPCVKIRGKVFFEQDAVRQALVRLYSNTSNLPAA